MRGSMDVFGLTDIGRKRDQNEDQFLIADLSKSMNVHQTSLGLDHQTRLFGSSQGKVLAVADGMGGQAAGERASGVAIDAMVSYVLNTMRWFFQLDDDCEDDLLDSLKESLEHCQARLREEAEAIPDRQGMGTTMTLVYLIWPRLYVVHVGDSRCYLFRGGRLEQLTRDHTIAEKFIEEGAMNRDDAEATRWRNVLWNVIGGGSNELCPEVSRINLEIGDVVLVCSDGLTMHVSDAEIADQLSKGASAEETCGEFVKTANAAGGGDNITVIVARFLDTGNALELAASHEESDKKDSEKLKDTDPYIQAV